MKKHFFTISVGLLTAATLYAASARLDFFNKAGEFFSVLEEDLVKLTWLQDDEASDVFTKVKVETKTGEQTLELAQIDKIAYAPATGKEPFAIDITDDGHCTVTFLDCLNNDGVIDPTKPNDWHGAESGYVGHFIYSPEYGYEMEVEFKGQYTGKVYTEDPNFIFFVAAEDYAKWTDSWGFLMPNEPITVAGKSTELTTYAGQPFVGIYKGYQLVKEPRVYTPAETAVSLDLRANGSYVVTSTDENDYDFHYMYNYNETAGKAEHVMVQRPEWDNFTIYYGATETFLGDDFVYMEINNYNTGSLEDRRYYLAAKGNFKYTGAASDFGQRYLLEATYGGDKVKYVFVDNYGSTAKLAEVKFIKGATIGAESEAIVSYDGEAHYKFVNNGVDNPQFIAKGIEAGTYKPGGEVAGDDLILDGFGNATLGSENHPYTFVSGVVTFTDNSRSFMLDTTAKTYSEVLKDDQWTGPVEFVIENAKGAYGSGESDKCYASVKFNQDLTGAEKQGFIALNISVWRGFELTSLITACPKYYYDSEAGTITLSGVLVGTGSGFNTEKRNLVLRVADDLQSMWFDETVNGEKIYGVSSPTDYFYTGTQNTLVAPKSGPTISGTYKATFPSVENFMMPGWSSPMPFSVDCSLTIDKDDQGNAKEGFAYIYSYLSGARYEIFNQVVEYEVADSKLILKNVNCKVDGAYELSQRNLEFTITDDGNLQGESIKVTGNADASNYSIDLGSVQFIHSAE